MEKLGGGEKRGKKSNIRFEWETEADKIRESEPGDGGKQSLFKVSFMTSPLIPKVSRLRREKKYTGSELSGAQLSRILRLQVEEEMSFICSIKLSSHPVRIQWQLFQESVTESSLPSVPPPTPSPGPPPARGTEGCWNTCRVPSPNAN